MLYNLIVLILLRARSLPARFPSVKPGLRSVCMSIDAVLILHDATDAMSTRVRDEWRQ